MRRALAGIVVVGTFGAGWVAGGQSPAAMTEDAMRALTATAISSANGNPDKAITLLDKTVKARWGDFDQGPIWLAQGDKRLAANIYPPYLYYREHVFQAIRKMEATGTLAFTNEVTLQILPIQIDGPDIIKVVVQRDGQTIEPVRGGLAAREFKNRLGATINLHAGSLSFPVSAFAPGGSIVVTLIPESGANYITNIDSKRLEKFK